MPAHRKPEGTRQDNSPARELATVVDINGGHPARRHAVVPSWLKQTKDQWEEFWQADVAKVLANHHIPALYRLFELRDAQARALRIYKRRPMVEGSQRQPVVNPAMGTVQALEKDIRALEDRLGLTPKAQANLGIKLGTAAKTAAEVNAAVREGEEDDDDSDFGGAEPGSGELENVIQPDGFSWSQT